MHTPTHTTNPRIAAATIEAVQAAVLDTQPGLLHPRGGGTKTALAPPPGATVLDLSGLTGIQEYEPGEFVFTALAGTALSTIQAALSAHGQSLPFDPPLAAQGATLGGTVAAGLSGSGRQRYGGVRDFLIGVRFVDGQGRLVRGGGKVVKNAAGFDLPKLMVGALGRLGVLVELSFKVFPRPHTYATLQIPVASTQDACTLIARLSTSTFDLEALDLLVDEDGHRQLLARLGGLPAVLAQRLDGLRALAGGGMPVDAAGEAEGWEQSRSFAWLPPSWWLVKVPLTLRELPALEDGLAAAGARRRYISSGNLAWIGWPGDLTALDTLLGRLQLAGLCVLGPAGRAHQPWLGILTGQAMAERLQQVLDPQRRFAAGGGAPA